MAIRYNERSHFHSLYEEINRIFKEIIRADPPHKRHWESMDIPPMDIFETDDAVRIHLELPGIDLEGIQLTFMGNRLVVEGLKSENADRGKLVYHCMERSFGQFQRVIPFFKAIDVNQASAEYAQGILRIVVPKISEKRGNRRSIPVAPGDLPEESS
jgi:HSP20 family protein